MISGSFAQRNVEIKARCHDLNKALQTALAFGAVPSAHLIQVDTYFRVPSGRLKLREHHAADDPDQLIFYDRPDSAGPRTSDYFLVQVPRGSGLKALLSTALGVRSVVRKRRELLISHNVRIHLDEVEGLGNFIELEAVVNEGNDQPISQARLGELIQVLEIAPQDLLACSYCEMSA